MKRKFKKLLNYTPQFVQDFIEMIFASAAENHIKLINSGRKKYRSYTQLKRHQKRVRMTLAMFFLILFSGLMGILVGPILFPQPAESEVYIPNGKGDILIGNISKNKFTVIFKTLDGANGNKPLATKATIEVFEDQNYTKLERRTFEDDYAVTHIIPVDSLQENKLYYIKITANDAATPVHTRSVISWGDGNDNIKVYTTGELISNCTPVENEKKIQSQIPEAILTRSEGKNIDENKQESKKSNENEDTIETVQNENYLQPGNKIQTIISWVTAKPATTVIIIGEERSGEKREITISDKIETKHAAILTTLKAGKTYYFKVQSKDADGNVMTSEEYSLRTPKAQENIVQKITNNFKGLIGQVMPK